MYVTHYVHTHNNCSNVVSCYLLLYNSGCWARHSLQLLTALINPRRACAARVTVVGFVCLSVSCLCVSYSTSHFTGVCSSHKGYDLLNGQ